MQQRSEEDKGEGETWRVRMSSAPTIFFPIRQAVLGNRPHLLLAILHRLNPVRVTSQASPKHDLDKFRTLLQLLPCPV